MTSDPTTAEVLSAVHDGVCNITLNRPKQLNAIGLVAASQLLSAIRDAEVHPDVRVVVVRGAGKGFCAGGDVHAMASADDAPAFLDELTGTLHAAILALSSLSKPVIASVHGVAAGAGLGLMLSADVVIATDDTKFVAAYARVGLTPDAGASVLVPAAVGTTRSLDFFLNTRSLDAVTAAEWGMITRHVPAAELDAEVGEQAEIFANDASGARGRTRVLLRSAVNRDLVHALLIEARTIALQSGTPTAHALISAFVGR